MLGLDAGAVIAVEAALSSFVLFMLIEGDAVPDSEAT
jgi:hypothetical protein